MHTASTHYPEHSHLVFDAREPSRRKRPDTVLSQCLGRTHPPAWMCLQHLAEVSHASSHVGGADGRNLKKLEDLNFSVRVHDAAHRPVRTRCAQDTATGTDDLTRQLPGPMAGRRLAAGAAFRFAIPGPEFTSFAGPGGDAVAAGSRPSRVSLVAGGIFRFGRRLLFSIRSSHLQSAPSFVAPIIPGCHLKARCCWNSCMNTRALSSAGGAVLPAATSLRFPSALQQKQIRISLGCCPPRPVVL